MVLPIHRAYRQLETKKISGAPKSMSFIGQEPRRKRGQPRSQRKPLFPNSVILAERSEAGSSLFARWLARAQSKDPVALPGNGDHEYHLLREEPSHRPRVTTISSAITRTLRPSRSFDSGSAKVEREEPVFRSPSLRMTDFGKRNCR